MKILALTGGIASGKSTVAKYFEELGAIVLDADKIAHQVYRKSSPSYQQIKKRYGKKVLHQNQSIDRNALANILFHSSKEKKWLEKLIHPATIELLRKKIEQAIQKKPKLILIEAALHVETGYYRQFDGMIAVWTPPQLQIERLIPRDKLSPTEAKQRLRSQIPLKKKCQLANWIIDNAGNRRNTQTQIRQLFKILTKDKKHAPKTR